MPSLDATLAYAVQVDVKKLGAHLEAYVNLLPAIETLRLCHRYGRGTTCMISELPAELITWIEDLLIAEERRRLLREWADDLRCYEQFCDPIDHVSERQIRAYRGLARKGKIPKRFPGSTVTFDKTEEDVECRIDCHLGDEFDKWCNNHYDRIHSWQDRVGMKSAARRGIFSEHKDLVDKHFALDMWISHVQLDEYMEENYWSISEIFPQESTVAYIKLPGSKRNFQAWTLSKYDRDAKDFFIESGYGMPTTVLPPLTDTARAKFSRMLKTLGLQPYTHWSQECSSLGPIKEDVKKDDDDPDGLSSEPQLTMLMRCITRSDEEG